MSLTEGQVVATIERLTVTRLHVWVTGGLVRPAAPGGAASYSELDVARLRLMCELCDDLEVSDEALPIVLSLLDQVYGLRRELRNLTRAVEEQPRSVQGEIAAALRRRSGHADG